MKNRASGTAEGVAYLRYYESGRPMAERICDDYMAYDLSAWWVKWTAKLCGLFPTDFMDRAFERKGIGVSGFIAVRTRAFDEFVHSEIHQGAQQYVILGAGLDSRPYRFADDLKSVKVFEVDHPLSQGVKKDRVKALLGQCPENVHYVPVDFIKDDLGDCLSQSGYDPTVKTLFTLEGVSMYLDEKSLTSTLSWIECHSGPGSAVLFDYVYAAAIDGRMKSKVITHMKNLKFIFNEAIGYGIEKDHVCPLLMKIGFTTAEDFPPEKLRELYLNPYAPSRTLSPLYGLALGRK